MAQSSQYLFDGDLDKETLSFLIFVSAVPGQIQITEFYLF